MFSGLCSVASAGSSGRKFGPELWAERKVFTEASITSAALGAGSGRAKWQGERGLAGRQNTAPHLHSTYLFRLGMTTAIIQLEGCARASRRRADMMSHNIAAKRRKLWPKPLALLEVLTGSNPLRARLSKLKIAGGPEVWAPKGPDAVVAYFASHFPCAVIFQPSEGVCGAGRRHQERRRFHRAAGGQVPRPSVSVARFVGGRRGAATRLYGACVPLLRLVVGADDGRLSGVTAAKLSAKALSASRNTEAQAATPARNTQKPLLVPVPRKRGLAPDRFVVALPRRTGHSGSASFSFFGARFAG